MSARTDIGRIRAENQDNYRAVSEPDNRAWAVVCDGMGGGQNGREASRIASDMVERRLAGVLKSDLTEDAVQELVCESIRQANEAVYRHTRAGEIVMGTTLVCAVVRGNVLHLAHAGDSRAYLFEHDTLKLLTRDHSMVQELVEQGALTPEEAYHHPDKNVITRALGVDREIDVEYGRGEMPEGGTLLLCTDGLTNMVPNERIAELMAQTDFYSLTDALVADALRAGGTDNITAVLMQMEEDGAHGG